MAPSKVVLLDRDGVLNEMVVHSEHGTIDSPMNPSEVRVFPWVPQALRDLCDLGFQLAICSNQPAAAKGKTTRENLEAVHEAVVEGATASGAVIAHSAICFHRAEEGCECRKPKPGLLLECIAALRSVDLSQSWMVGDGVTDIQAGIAAGVKTAYFGVSRPEYRRVFVEKGLSEPDLWCENLKEFAERLKRGK